MINHARTLLLNKAAKTNHVTVDTGAEFVPNEFFPVNLTNELRLVRRVLFGSNPDARFINLRIRELMGYVHQTELAQYVYDLDPRVTYWPMTPTDFNDIARNQIVVTQLSGPPQRLALNGAVKPDHSVGRAVHTYLISVGVANTLNMRTMKLQTPDSDNTILTIQTLGTTQPPETYSVGGVGSTSTASLPQTDLKLLLNFASPESPYANIVTEKNEYVLYEDYATTGPLESEQFAATMPLTSGIFSSILAQWLIVAKSVPDSIVTTLLPTLELLGEPVFLSLFGVENIEPYATFKNLWFDHYSPVYRLAGLTMAIIYRTEELRK
ncbi:hypothetical protein EBZ39_00245 [bacterium]|nr:hypothetical protein [bacterium]